MKNILVLVILIFLFYCCENKSDCYNCKITFDVTHRDSVESVSWSVSDTKEMCDMTDDQIREFEVQNMDTLVEVSGTVTTTTITSAKCTR